MEICAIDITDDTNITCNRPQQIFPRGLPKILVHISTDCLVVLSRFRWLFYIYVHKKVMIVGLDLLIFLYAFPWVLDFLRVI